MQQNKACNYICNIRSFFYLTGKFLFIIYLDASSQLHKQTITGTKKIITCVSEGATNGLKWSRARLLPSKQPRKENATNLNHVGVVKNNRERKKRLYRISYLLADKLGNEMLVQIKHQQHRRMLTGRQREQIDFQVRGRAKS